MAQTIHFVLDSRKSTRTACGVAYAYGSEKTLAVGPKHAQHATCERCVRSLRKGFAMSAGEAQ